MTVNTNRPEREVLRAQRAIRRGGDTRALKRELQHGNHYVFAWLHRKGLAYVRGSGIVRMREIE